MQIDDKAPAGGPMIHFGIGDAQRLKFLAGDNVGEVKCDQYTAWKCYVEAIKSSSNKMEVDLPIKESGRNFTQQEDHRGAVRARVQLAEELLSIQLVLGDLDKITKIGFQMSPILAGQLTIFL
ncbi:UNVERIFIED_CONTAM: hypothetical protein Slati_1363500 [Sesamum latifolium]|uniref:Uncharacterized protein n=1 Tax=Sesamum latifolium TaxID=2727402 RepID=A0AAW2XL57_9LAMI